MYGTYHYCMVTENGWGGGVLRGGLRKKREIVRLGGGGGRGTV
jgi:hypothetical protein